MVLLKTLPRSIKTFLLPFRFCSLTSRNPFKTTCVSNLKSHLFVKVFAHKSNAQLTIGYHSHFDILLTPALVVCQSLRIMSIVLMHFRTMQHHRIFEVSLQSVYLSSECTEQCMNRRKISIFIDYFVLCICMLSQNLPNPSGIKWL